MEAGESTGVSFVILDQPPAARRPGEGSFDHPAPGQKDEAAFCFGQLDDLEGNPPLPCRLSRRGASIALIDIGEGDGLAGSILNGFGKAAHFGAIIDVGGRHVQGEQMAKRISERMEKLKVELGAPSRVMKLEDADASQAK